MPFDLSTAQPAQPQSSGGFDLSTAQPIQQQEQPQTLLERFKANQQARQTESLKQTLADESWLGRNLAGIGSAAAKTYYGGKQLLQGGTLSPEDQSAVKDWSTIESAAPVGAIAGNMGMLALPGTALSKIPLAAGVGKAILAPATALQAAGVGAGYSALQPTEQQGIEGLKQRGIEALKGGAAGVAGYGLAKGAGKILNPTVSPAVQLLQNEGIPTTFGQTLGGRTRVTEGKLTSTPILGDLIASQQGKGIDALNVAAYNRALSPIGEKSSGKVGFEGVEEVHKKLSEKYADIAGKMHFNPDGQFGADLSKIRTMVDELPPESASMYDKMLNRIVASRATPQGTMSGETLKSVESEITKEVSSLRSGAPSYAEKKIADALEAAQSAMRENLARQNPKWAEELKNVNQGWANYAIIRDAASTATGRKGGAFTPANLASAVSSNAKKQGGMAAGKGIISEGKATMQDLSSAAENVLAPAYPDSGTAGRILPWAAGMAGAGGSVATGTAAPLAALGGLAMTPYLSNKLTNAILTKRPELLRAAGNKLSELAPYGALAGTAAAQ